MSSGILKLIHKALLLNPRLGKEIEKYILGYNELRAYDYIKEFGPVSTIETERLLGFSRSATQRLTYSLYSKGYIKRYKHGQFFIFVIKENIKKSNIC